MRRHLIFLLAALVASAGAQLDCDVADDDRIDCGFVGSTQESCEADGCCWGIPEVDDGTPFCFFDGSVADSCDGIVWEAPDAGFDAAILDTIYANYQSQLNWEGTGAVVAAPDADTPGGSYIYHWMRDGALSIKGWMDINDNSLDATRTEVEAYKDWVAVVQRKDDPNGIDVRCEPKFYIETAEPYDGGWCRPQNDGPALRAMALCKYGFLLLEAGEDTSEIWNIVSFDLEWVLQNFDQEGCDLWEEVRSTDFYWNRMSYVYSLNEVAKFAEAIGEDPTPYTSKANEILPTAEAHFNGEYIYESDNREQDSAVLHAIASFGEYSFDAASEEAAATLAKLSKTFCQEYPIMQADIGAGEPGVLFGRYPGDSYAGGNPWPLLTAVAAEVFYLGGSINADRLMERGVDDVLDRQENKHWIDLLSLPEGAKRSDLIARQISAGDAVMTSLYKYVGPDGGKVDEQIDKFTGEQASAENLTWSYANILHTIWVRDGSVAKLAAVKERFA